MECEGAGIEVTATDRALEILRQHPEGMMAHEFACLMWPESPYWTRIYKVGRGATRGAAMWRCAGGFLGRLCARGLIERRINWHKAYLYTAMAESVGSGVTRDDEWTVKRPLKLALSTG